MTLWRSRRVACRFVARTKPSRLESVQRFRRLRGDERASAGPIDHAFSTRIASGVRTLQHLHTPGSAGGDPPSSRPPPLRCWSSRRPLGRCPSAPPSIGGESDRRLPSALGRVRGPRTWERPGLFSQSATSASAGPQSHPFFQQRNGFGRVRLQPSNRRVPPSHRPPGRPTHPPSCHVPSLGRTEQIPDVDRGAGLLAASFVPSGGGRREDAARVSESARSAPDALRTRAVARPRHRWHTFVRPATALCPHELWGVGTTISGRPVRHPRRGFRCSRHADAAGGPGGEAAVITAEGGSVLNPSRNLGRPDPPGHLTLLDVPNHDVVGGRSPRAVGITATQQPSREAVSVVLGPGSFGAVHGRTGCRSPCPSPAGRPFRRPGEGVRAAVPAHDNRPVVRRRSGASASCPSAGRTSEPRRPSARPARPETATLDDDACHRT